MIIYLIKSTFLLLIFAAIYKVSLDKKKALKFKRFFLLFSVCFALLFPLINFQYQVKSNPIIETKGKVIEQMPVLLIESFENKPTTDFNYIKIAYLIITAFFILNFLKNIIYLWKLKRKSTHISTQFGTIALHAKVKSPFSFYTTIFVNFNDWQNAKIDDAILHHEQAHVLQKHTLDVLFIEILKTVMWFQPFLFFFKRFIQENHEYLADEVSLNKSTNIKHYQNLILNYYNTTEKVVALSSSIHFNNLKKRFIMMKNTKKAKVWSSIFYTTTALITYFGFVGIEAKANDINKIETVIENKIEKISSPNNENFNVEQREIKKALENKSEVIKKIEDHQKDSLVIIKFKKNQNYTDVFVHPTTKDVYLYLVSPDQSSVLVRNLNNRNENILTDISKHNINFKLIEKESDEAHSFVEKKAMPKEGLTSFMQNFAREFKTPKSINADEIKMRLKFIVETDGSFSNILTPQEYFKPDESYLALQEEAVRTLKTMPNWSPAENEGKIVRSTFTLPITIKVNPNKIDVVN